MRKIEVVSTSVEKAIEKGLIMLGTSKENVDVKVLEENSMLKKVKIEMTVYADGEEHTPTELPTSHTKKTKKVVKQRKEPAYDPEQNKLALEVARKYMEGLLNASGFEYNLNVEEIDNYVHVVVSGEKMGSLIGYHGEGMDAIQMLLNQYVRDNIEGYERKIYLDIEEYRSKRENTLKDMATRLAEKVVKNRRSLKLEPMTSYDRRIIHTHLAEMPHIDTHSEGTEPHRYLVIDYVN